MNFSFSEIKIEKVEIESISKTKPVKKARSVAKSGYFEIRMNWVFISQKFIILIL